MGRKESKILVFKLGNQLWGIDLKYVREVVKVKEYTKVPMAADHVLGVFNLRGQIVVLLDISKILSIGRAGSDNAIILSYNGEVIGVSVDAVIGVLSVGEEEILPPPHEAGEYVKGIIRHREELIGLLDTEKTLKAIERSEFL